MKHGTRLALAMVFFLLLAPPILAQETPTDAPTDIPPATATFTETPIPTETPTYTAIPTQTPTETATVTETPSETPSETPTTTMVETPSAILVETATTISSETTPELFAFTVEAATAIQVESPTATATATPPELTTLLSDSFDSAFPTQWILGPVSSVAPGDNGGYVLRSYNDDRLSPTIEGEFYNVVAEARFLVEWGSAMIDVRRSQAGSYAARLLANGTVELYRSDVLIASGTAASPGVWHTLRLSAVGGDIRVSLDGIEAITWLDPSPVPAGIVRVTGGHPGQSGFSLDNVAISGVPTGDGSLPEAAGKMAAAEMYLQSAGDQIIYTQVVNGHSVIYAMDSDGSNSHALTADTYNSGSPTVSADGLQIAFVSDHDTPNTSDLYVMDSDGSNIQRVTTIGNVGQPSWSPDGSQIVFVSYDGDQEISLVNVDGSGVEQVTHNTTEDISPKWSPDGTEIAYSSIYRPDDYSAFWRVMVMNPDGSNQTYLTDDDVNAYLPDWSHDGTAIAYTQQGLLQTQYGAYPYYDIYKMAANGGNQTNLTQTVTVTMNGSQYFVNESSAAWSPTDNQIIYAREVGGSFIPPVEYNAWVMNNNGSGQTYLFTLGTQTTLGDWEVLQAPPEVTATPTATSTCTTTITADANLRSSPSTEATVLRVIPTGSLIGLYGTNYERDWYFVQFIEYGQGYLGWVHNSVVTYVPCLENLPYVDVSGTPVPPPTPTATPTFTPTPDPFQCIGLSILDGDFVNIRDFPIGGNIIGSFGNGENVSTPNVQITGRYTANTPDQRWDDWYKVAYTDIHDNQNYEGWVSAEYTTLRPSYRDPLCAVPGYTSNENNELIEGPPVAFPTEPTPVPPAANLYAYAQVLQLPAPFTHLATDATMFSIYGWSQGYGLNEFVYRHPNYYEETHHIHSGMDFGGIDTDSPTECIASSPSACIRILPICDGVVVTTNGTTGTNTGAGFITQCYTIEGSRSNIYVSYNHLQDLGEPGLQNNDIVLAGVERGLNALQYEGNETPHLHMEVLYDNDGDLSDAIRINPLLLFDEDTATTIINHAGSYYPIDLIEDDGTRLQFEWPDPDTVDPVEVQEQPYDGVAFNNADLGRKQEDAVEDLDLGIQYGELDLWRIVADQLTLPTDVCTFVWGRTDQQILFRYSPSQSCITSGIQDLSENNNEYDGPEWLTDAWVLSIEALIQLLLTQ